MNDQWANIPEFLEKKERFGNDVETGLCHIASSNLIEGTKKERVIISPDRW